MSAAVVIIPAAPASAQVASRCEAPAEFTVCAMVEFNANGSWRAIQGIVRAHITWNYKDGQRRGSMDSPVVWETPCYP
jgi:hypothetical protein